MVLDECLHCAIRQSLIELYALLLAIDVEAMGNQHPCSITNVLANTYLFVRDCGFFCCTLLVDNHLLVDDLLGQCTNQAQHTGIIL